MINHTTRSEDSVIERARSAPTFKDLIVIIEGLDTMVSERDSTIQELNDKIDELNAELREERDRTK
jgi:hypothetical protein